METENILIKCDICNKIIHRGEIPRLAPTVSSVICKDGTKYNVCDTCGNMLTVVYNMYTSRRVMLGQKAGDDSCE